MIGKNSKMQHFRRAIAPKTTFEHYDYSLIGEKATLEQSENIIYQLSSVKKSNTLAERPE